MSNDTTWRTTRNIPHWTEGADLEDTFAMRVVRKFCAQATPMTLLLGGPTGTGKSVAAAWACLQPATYRSPWGTPFASRTHDDGWDIKHHPRMISAPELAALSVYTWDRDDAAVLLQCSLVVVDDVDLPELKPGKSGQANLDWLIDGRVRMGLRTVITSNLTADDLRSNLGKRSLSRLRQSSAFVDCKGEDLRTRPMPEAQSQAFCAPPERGPSTKPEEPSGPYVDQDQIDNLLVQLPFRRGQ